MSPFEQWVDRRAHVFLRFSRRTGVPLTPAVVARLSFLYTLKHGHPRQSGGRPVSRAPRHQAGSYPLQPNNFKTL